MYAKAIATKIIILPALAHEMVTELERLGVKTQQLRGQLNIGKKIRPKQEKPLSKRTAAFYIRLLLNEAGN